jgi:hypothetical protein
VRYEATKILNEGGKYDMISSVDYNDHLVLLKPHREGIAIPTYLKYELPTMTMAVNNPPPRAFEIFMPADHEVETISTTDKVEDTQYIAMQKHELEINKLLAKKIAELKEKMDRQKDLNKEQKTEQLAQIITHRLAL